jgi:hypothetical protein
MSRLEFAGEFRRDGSRTMVVRKSRKRIRSGPGVEIDERARAAAGAKARTAFWQNHLEFHQ